MFTAQLAPFVNKLLSGAKKSWVYALFAFVKNLSKRENLLKREVRVYRTDPSTLQVTEHVFHTHWDTLPTAEELPKAESFQIVCTFSDGSKETCLAKAYNASDAHWAIVFSAGSIFPGKQVIMLSVEVCKPGRDLNLFSDVRGAGRTLVN